MAVTSFHEQTGKWLTGVGAEKVPGDQVTLSFSHPLLCSQFTTYKLGAVVAHDQRGIPLFDLKEALVEIAGEFRERALLDAIRSDFEIREFTMNGMRFRRTGMGDFSYQWEKKCA